MQRLTTNEQRTRILDQSTGPVIVYKHNSNQCPISKRILPQIEAFADEYEHPVVAIDIITDRELSNQITSQAEISHESPQCIVFDSTGTCIDTCSHGRIKPERVRMVVEG